MAGKRLLFGAIGLAGTGLAVLGVWLPGLPTTPFVLIALWAFTRSSESLSAWLRRIPMLRGAIAAADQYQRERTLPLAVKVIAQSAAWLAVPIVFLVTGSTWITAAVVAAALGCTVFMTLTPTRGAASTQAKAATAPSLEVRSLE
ncbi:MAG: YbaN family protein [Cryobacterium sp.]|nr:YbaN family protein [Cryobacterium sp.]